MIKFFRQIRLQLMETGKTGKYFKYAIGEIILVVIGILIALQINNWNEARKENRKLKTALNSVYNDILQDSMVVYNELPNVKMTYELNARLSEKAYASSTNLDTLIQLMKEDFPIYWITPPPFNRNAFDNLKSTGSFDLLPEDIKISLSEYYTNLDSGQKLLEPTLEQYRYHLDDFVKHYNILGRIQNKNYRNSYLFNSSWESVDEKDFTPRVAVLLGAYNVLYNSVKQYLEQNQTKIRGILPLLKPYIE